MQDRNQLAFLFNSKPYPFNIDVDILNSVNRNIANILIRDHIYTVQSNVSLEVFKGFINYLLHGNTNIPNITPQNIHQYYLLNQEFQNEAMTNLIESQAGSFDELTVNLINLKDPLIRDKKIIEQSIAQNLDEYLTERGDELISAPINSLIRILSDENLVFTEYDRLYELIVSENQRTNSLSIFILLPFLKLNQLSLENQRDSITQENARAGMIPKHDILAMINEIEKQKQEINQMKENHRQVSLMFIRNQILNSDTCESFDEATILDACERGDFETVSMFLSNKIDIDCLRYRLNLNDFTATIIPIHREIFQEELIIPKSINYKNIEFIVTSIDRHAIEYSEISNIIFPEDSQVRFIDEEAFYGTFETIKLPPLLEKYLLKDSSFLFENINLWPNSRHITKINNQFLAEKSDINSDVFDVISLVNPNIQTLDIPNYITKISENAFKDCTNVKEVNFTENSHLQIIESGAFSYSGIESITIPSHVNQICKYAFNFCRNLRTVNFAPNSELSSFESSIFSGCSIENLTIPCNLKTLHRDALHYSWSEGINDFCHISISPENHNFLFLNEKIILGKSDQNSDNFDVILFACGNIEEENIPDWVRIIGPYAFAKCKRLRTIHFSENSQLSMICEGAFDQSSLQIISIPSHVQQIPHHVFSNCQNLTVNFEPDSEIRSFDENAFFDTSIQSLFIPKNVEEVQSMFYKIKSINRIAISPENHNYRVLNEKILLGKTNQSSDDYDIILFASNDCVNENIPDYIKQIGQYAFSTCKRLQEINFSENSQLSIIDAYAFLGSSLEQIIIPPHVTEIRERAFSKCKQLRSFNFSPNSELRIIGLAAFISSSIRSISIPPSVIQIQDNVFYSTSFN